MQWQVWWRVTGERHLQAHTVIEKRKQHLQFHTTRLKCQECSCPDACMMLQLLLVMCRGSSGGGSQERVTFKQLVKSPADMPSPDAKPEYHNAICTVANIEPQQSMYYQACPDNNRKASLCHTCQRY